MEPDCGRARWIGDQQWPRELVKFMSLHSGLCDVIVVCTGVYAYSYPQFAELIVKSAVSSVILMTYSLLECTSKSLS